MDEKVIPESRHTPSFSEREEDGRKRRQSGSPLTGGIPETKLRKLSQKEWEQLIKYLPLTRKIANQVVVRLSKMGLVINPQDVQDSAFDYLIEAIKKTTKKKKDERNIQMYLAFLYRQFTKLILRKAKAKREIQGNQYVLLEKTPARNDGDVERVIEECGGLPIAMKTLLMKVVHKREDEALTDILTAEELYEWWMVVRPYLKQWAKERELTDRV